MQNQDSHIDYPDLISRYLSGNVSDSEVQILEAWVLADSKNKAQFVAFKKAWILSGMQSAESVDVEQQWQQTKAQISSEAKVLNLRPKSSRRNWLAIAASVAILILASFWLFQQFSSQGPLLVEAKDQKEEFDLPDGSKITLNQASTLSYVFDADNKERRVDLKGDAFFDVFRDETRPFIIEASEIEIEVLGTSFYVDARSTENEVQVIVQSGSVAVRANGQEVILSANEKAIFEKQNQGLSKSENQDPNYLSLTNQTLIFKETKLSDVVFAINRQYGVKISISNPELKDCKLSARYENKSLEAVLTILQTSLKGIKVQRQGKQIEITGNACE